jgi:conjugal transfer/entry exclusion protein
MDWIWIILFLLMVVLAIYLIVLTIYFWYISIPLIAISYFIYKNVQQKREREKRDKEEKAQLKKYYEEQAEYHNQLINLSEDSLVIFESLPNHLQEADNFLDQSERNFNDRAFAPFWDAIERVTKSLGRFEESIEAINNNANQYIYTIENYDAQPPNFPLKRSYVKKLKIGAKTSERQQEIVREAQRDFQFAMIYEQRKTNQILVAGFTNLANALNEMTWKISNSIDQLSEGIFELSDSLDKTRNALHSKMTDIQKDISKEGSEREKREERILEILEEMENKYSV